MTFEDRGRGVVGTLGMKAPCVAASTGNLTLSGEQSVDGVALVAGDRVLVKDQTDATENGIYAVALSNWEREPDFDGPDDVAGGTKIPVNQGTQNFNTIWGVTNVDDITVGTTEITFGNFVTSGNAVAAEAAQAGAEAAQAGAEAAASDSATSAAEAAVSAAAAQAQLTATSSTSLGIGAGSKVFTTQTGRAFQAGVFIIAYSAGDPTNWMIGQSASYSGTTLTLTVGVDDFEGAGTYTDWILQISGARGPEGPTGPAGAGSGDMLKSENLSGLADYPTARSNLGVAIGSDVQAYDAATAKTDEVQTFTVSQRASATTDADGSFDMNATNDFLWTPTGNDTLEFTNETAGQRGLIRLVNPSAYTISLGAEVDADTDVATELSQAGTYVISYWCYNGTDVAISFAKVG
jgi:hypothetical protein